MKTVFYKELTHVALEINTTFQNQRIHQAQDIFRGAILRQPGIVIYNAVGQIICFSVIEINSFKRGHLWYGPVIKSDYDLESVLRAMLRALFEFNIWHLTLHSSDYEIYAAIKNLVKGKQISLAMEKESVAIAIKKIDGLNETQLLKTYKTRLRKSLAIAKENHLVVNKIKTRENVNELGELFVNMYMHRGISMDFGAYKDRLLSDMNYVLDTGKGSIFGAYLNNTCIGCSVQIYHGDTAYYLCAATDKSYDFPIMHLIVHKAILEAMQSGYTYFDFGSYYPETIDKQLMGLNVFKNAFGIEVMKKPPTVIIGYKKMHLTFIHWLVGFKNLVLGMSGKKSVNL